MSLDDFRMRRDVFYEACAAAQRDPDEITISTLLRFDGDPGSVLAQAEAYEAVGVDLGLIAIPKSASPGTIEDLADALG